jgi:hypothetical protein
MVGNFLVQAILFLAGLVIEVYTSTLSQSSQKKALRVIAGLLIAVALVWTGYRLANIDHPTAPTADGETPVATNPVTSISTQKPTNIPQGDVPSLSGGSVWVDSYPSGANVYVIPALIDLDELRLEDIVKPENLKGSTPLAFDLPRGDYYAAFSYSADVYAASGITLPTYSSPAFEGAFPFEGNLMTSTSLSNGEYISSVEKVYRLNKQGNSSESLISVALPLAEGEQSALRPSIYPQATTVSSLPVNFTFKEDVLRGAIEDDLARYNLTGQVGAEMVDSMVEVLQKVGKIILNTDTVRIIIQMGADDTFTITIYE